jgi:hypothetical protein
LETDFNLAVVLPRNFNLEKEGIWKQISIWKKKVFGNRFQSGRRRYLETDFNLTEEGIWQQISILAEEGIWKQIFKLAEETFNFVDFNLHEEDDWKQISIWQQFYHSCLDVDVSRQAKPSRKSQRL